MPERHPSKARGFTLIEVLVALVVLAVGLLGFTGLKLASIKHYANANARATASIHAQDMFDRMRANVPAAEAGRYNITAGDSLPGSPATVAELDLTEWAGQLAASLPQGTGSVVVAAGNIATVSVLWIERESESAQGRTLEFLFESRL